VVTMLACFVLFAREAVGAGQGTRHSLRPLSSRVPSMQPSDANAPRERGLISSRLFDIQIESLKQRVHPLRHARASRGHPRLASGNASRPWMTGTRPGHEEAERIAADFGTSRERRSIHLVMPALVAGIHALLQVTRQDRGLPGQGPAMRKQSESQLTSDRRESGDPSTSSCPRLSRASTPSFMQRVKTVDDRHKARS
jgi:hypothetical protein